MSQINKNMKLNLGHPEKNNLFYSFLHNTMFRVIFSFWYKRIAISGYKRLYSKNPIILAPNHQNALMDPLVILGIEPRQIVWIARADIFKSPIAAFVLRYMRILPAFRQRDGKELLAQNDIVFNKCIDILAAKQVLGLFAEGTHWGFRRLRPTKKVISRIAFMAEEAHDFKLNVEVVPVGIYYDNYTSVRRKIYINFGDPIYVKDFEELYKTNPAQASTELKDTIEEGMKKQMLHINHEGDLYDAYEILRYICEEQIIKPNSLGRIGIKKQFKSHKKIIEVLDNAKEQNNLEFESIITDALEYNSKIKKYNFRDWLVAKKGGDAFQIIWNILKLIIGFPIFIIGFLTNGFLFIFINNKTKKLVKDPQFYNSVSFFLVLILGPVLYGLYAIPYLLLVPYAWWTVFIFLIGLIITGVIAFEYYIVGKKTFHMLRFNYYLVTDNSEIHDLIKIRKKIIKTFSTILKN